MTAAPRLQDLLADSKFRDRLIADRLPKDYAAALGQHVVPLLPVLGSLARKRKGPLLVGINGCQGSGKSTLSRHLAWLLDRGLGVRCLVLSMDDFYLDKSQRQDLAAREHPLLATRGVPGTHDVDLGLRVLDQLLVARGRARIPIPRFDKLADERLPESRWRHWSGSPDIVLFEGWCVGCPAEAETALEQPVNALERIHDADGRWRRFVNDQLHGSYARWFDRLDALITLLAPNFDLVLAWRFRQEQRLAAEAATADAMTDQRIDLPDGAVPRPMTREQVADFIAYFERLTRHMMHIMPDRSDGVLQLNEDQCLIGHSGPLFNTAGCE